MALLFLIIIILFLVVGFISANRGINRISSMSPQQLSEEEQRIKEEAKEQERKAHNRRVYKSRYNYWYDKSYDVIDGCAAQSARKRDAYARRHALQDIKKYHWE